MLPTPPGFFRTLHWLICEELTRLRLGLKHAYQDVTTTWSSFFWFTPLLPLSYGFLHVQLSLGIFFLVCYTLRFFFHWVSPRPSPYVVTFKYKHAGGTYLFSAHVLYYLFVTVPRALAFLTLVRVLGLFCTLARWRQSRTRRQLYRPALLLTLTLGLSLCVKLSFLYVFGISYFLVTQTAAVASTLVESYRGASDLTVLPGETRRSLRRQTALADAIYYRYSAPRDATLTHLILRRRHRGSLDVEHGGRSG